MLVNTVARHFGRNGTLVGSRVRSVRMCRVPVSPSAPLSACAREALPRGSGRTFAVVGAAGAVGAGALWLTHSASSGAETACEDADAPGAQGSSTNPLDALDASLDRPWDFDWDGRHGQGKGGKGKRTLVFVRHGQYEHGSTDEERILTPLGREQARRTGQRLHAMYPGKIDRIVYSTMSRATETANIIREELPSAIPAEKSDSIREGAVFPPIPEHDKWKPSPTDFEADGARIEGAFREHIHRSEAGQDQNTVEVYVCHGNVIRYFFMRGLQLPPSAWLRTSVANGSMTVLRIGKDGTVGADQLGESGYMPVPSVTYN